MNNVLFPCFQLVLEFFEKQRVSAKVKLGPNGEAMVKNTGIESKINGEHPNGKFSNFWPSISTHPGSLHK